MRPQDVLEQLRRKPFVPLLIRLSNGNDYQVNHPDLVLVDRSAIYVGTPAPDLPVGVSDGIHLVSLLHVSQIIPAPHAITGKGNDNPA